MGNYWSSSPSPGSSSSATVVSSSSSSSSQIRSSAALVQAHTGIKNNNADDGNVRGKKRQRVGDAARVRNNAAAAALALGMKDVVGYIFQYASAETLCSAMAVNRLWRDAAQSSELWKNLCIARWPGTAPLFQDPLFQDRFLSVRNFRQFYKSKHTEYMDESDTDSEDEGPFPGDAEDYAIFLQLIKYPDKVIASNVVPISEAEVTSEDPTNTFSHGHFLKVPVGTSSEGCPLVYNDNFEIQFQYRLKISLIRCDEKVALLFDSNHEKCATSHPEGWHSPLLLWWEQGFSPIGAHDSPGMKVCVSVSGTEKNATGFNNRRFDVAVNAFYITFQMYFYPNPFDEEDFYSWCPSHDSFETFCSLAKLNWQ